MNGGPGLRAVHSSTSQRLDLVAAASSSQMGQGDAVDQGRGAGPALAHRPHRALKVAGRLHPPKKPVPPANSATSALSRLALSWSPPRRLSARPRSPQPAGRIAASDQHRGADEGAVGALGPIARGGDRADQVGETLYIPVAADLAEQQPAPHRREALRVQPPRETPRAPAARSPPWPGPRSPRPTRAGRRDAAPSTGRRQRGGRAGERCVPRLRLGQAIPLPLPRGWRTELALQRQPWNASTTSLEAIFHPLRQTSFDGRPVRKKLAAARPHHLAATPR